jgi:hypothetical protein
VNKKRSVLKKYRNMAGFAGLVLGMFIFLVPASAFGQAFEGAEYCSGCHEAKYNEWKTSGHPYIMMKGEDAKNRPIPLPSGKDWSDISYVIGGYGPKSLYLDNNGYIVTTPGNQYNYLTGQWTNYHVGEANLPYDCGSCHTTNYMVSGNQDGLAGILGTFDAPGVQCEQCHGNGFASMDKDTPKAAAFCGTCHTSGESSAAIPAKDGFILSNGQYNELLAGPHSGKNCVDCHDPHKPAEFGIITECESCHANKVASFTAHSMSDYGVECKDCHMPYATLAGQAQGTFEGDRRTHLFYINTDEQDDMFTQDGEFVALDFAVPGKPEKVNKGAVTLDYACKRCHETAEMSELGKFAKNFHGRDTTASQLEYIGLNPGLTGNWWGGPNRNGEGFLLEVADSGGLTLVVSFYTYDAAGNQVWLIAFGPANTGMSSTVTVFISSGRKWGEDANQADFTDEFGTATFTFSACNSGSFTLTPNAEYMSQGFSSIGYELFRDITTYKIACPTFINNPN